MGRVCFHDGRVGAATSAHPPLAQSLGVDKQYRLGYSCKLRRVRSECARSSAGELARGISLGSGGDSASSSAGPVVAHHCNSSPRFNGGTELRARDPGDADAKFASYASFASFAGPPNGCKEERHSYSQELAWSTISGHLPANVPDSTQRLAITSLELGNSRVAHGTLPNADHRRATIAK